MEKYIICYEMPQNSEEVWDKLKNGKREQFKNRKNEDWYYEKIVNRTITVITDMYEPHGFFTFDKYIILYGHEDIWVYDKEEEKIIERAIMR